MLKNLHRTVIIKSSTSSRKHSASSIESDSTSTKSEKRITLPLKIQQPLQPLKEVSEPNTPDNLKIPQTAKVSTRKSRFQKPVKMTTEDLDCSFSSSSDGSEHDVWNDDEILLKGIHLGELQHLSQTDELQMLYKIRFETFPNRKEPISETQLALETQKLIDKLKFHYLKFKKILPLDNLEDYTAPYSVIEDQNYMKFWDYYRDRNNHRRHKKFTIPTLKCTKENKSQQPLNPIIRNNQKINTQYRIKSLNSRRI